MEVEATSHALYWLSVQRERPGRKRLSTGEAHIHSFITCNLNRLAVRMKKGDMQSRLNEVIGERRPDVISFQEVRLECEPGSPGVVKRGSSDEAGWEAFMPPLQKSYNAYLACLYRRKNMVVRRYWCERTWKPRRCHSIWHVLQDTTSQGGSSVWTLRISW